MALVVVASSKGAPGVTTTALGLATVWPDQERVVLVEADPSGGSLAARWRLGYEPGLLSLAGAGRRGVDGALLRRHAQSLGTLSVLCGPASGDQARAAVAAIAPHLVAVANDVDLIVDVGRIGTWSPAAELVRAAAATLVVTRAELDGVQHVPALVQLVADLGGSAQLVTIGDEPYVPAEIADFAACELLGVLADDARGAAMLAGRPGSQRQLRRSALWRDLHAISDSLVRRLRPQLSEPGERARRAIDALADHSESIA